MPAALCLAVVATADVVHREPTDLDGIGVVLSEVSAITRHGQPASV